MIAISSDELRSHLAPLRNAAEVLKLAALASGEAQRAAAMLERQVAGMARLLDELVAAAQSNAPEPILRRVETTVQIIVTHGVEMVEPLMCARRQTLSIQMPVAPLRLEADPMWLTHAVRNVIGSAVKYTEPGGRIEVRVELHGCVAVISVRDNGVGESPDQLAGVFDLHTLFDRRTKRPSAGEAGAGLHLAELVVDAHGGSIRALTDGVSHRTTFVIRLPITPP